MWAAGSPLVDSRRCELRARNLAPNAIKTYGESAGHRFHGLCARPSGIENEIRELARRGGHKGLMGRMRAEELPDAVLWDRAVAGDSPAIGVLFERHARSVYNHCFRRTASWADAEELMSAVFVETWRRRREVRLHGDSALPWLLGVANNLLRNHRRSLRRYRAALVRLPDPGPQPDPADDVAGRLADEQQMRRVLAVVEQLPQRDQEILSLCAWSELSYREAAAVLDIPVGTVRSRLARARARLTEATSAGNSPSAEDTDEVELG